jgi:electron transport complex protein RnfC
MPCRLADFAEHSDKEAFRSEYGLECVECGCCSYQCPAKRPLAQEIKAMKRTIMADMRKAK